MPDVPLKMVPLQPAEMEARKHYQTLIEAFPDLSLNADARFELAELLGERGEHDAAIKLLRDALDKEPSAELTDKIRLCLGDCLLRKGDAKAALAQFAPLAANAKSASALRRSIAPASVISTYRLPPMPSNNSPSSAIEDRFRTCPA